MKYELLITEPADSEIIHAYNWYEDQQRGLGESFLDELESYYPLLEENPLLFQHWFNGIRAAVLRKFPYIIIYEIVGDKVIVLAVFHTSRDPLLWKSRHT